MTSIVIADDEIGLVDTLIELLEINKFDIVGIANDGKHAAELCLKFTPDFLIMDLSMPKFDGFFTLEKIQNLTQTKIIVLTGVIDEAILKKITPFDVFSLQMKPIMIKDLLKLLNS